jgi:hypothetical protein
MRKRLRFATCGALLLAACSGDHGPLPDGPALGGYANVGKAESYSGATLYGYMDGGADTFLEYGFSRLWVRRYARGATQIVVELYAMRDAAAASALYSSMRGASGESDLAPSCRGTLTQTEARVARGDRYLVCRDENPLAKENVPVRDLCARLLARLTGECGVGGLFAGLPASERVAGSEVALAGPLGLNQRAWLTPLGREGFQRGSLAAFTFPGGRAEALLADYASAQAARAALEPLRARPRPGTIGLTRGPRVVLVFSNGTAEEPLMALATRLAQPQEESPATKPLN